MEAAIASAQPASCCSLKAKHAQSSTSKLTPFVKETEGLKRIELQVDGIHCAKCIWAIESRLQKEAAITHARVNMSTARLVIEWRGDAGLADSFASMVDALGYKTQPISQKTSKQKDEASRLLRYMVIAGFAMGNIMMISVPLWSSEQLLMGLATRDLLHWISAAIALPTIAYAGQPFFASAFNALRAGHTNMDVPISLALILASGMSVFETIHSGEHAYFDSAVMLLFFLLIGRWLDAKARGKARQHATELLALLQGTATLLREGKTQTVAISELAAEDSVLVAAGEKVPADVEVLSGHSEMDTSLITGESLPRAVQKGDTLYGGTINLAAPLTCRVLQPSEDSLLAEVIRLMEKAEQGRARYVRLADKAAKLYTPVVHTLAAAAFVGWFFFSGATWQEALLIAITTLIITCPCALGLAVPAVQVLTTEWLMKRGILLKSADALERLTTITRVVFDKTGTLTQGTPAVHATDADETQKRIAASLADHSKHPLSKAISNAFEAQRMEVHQLEEVPGEGVYGVIDEKRYCLGKAEHTESEHTMVALQCEGEVLAHFHLTDPLRADASETVSLFAASGLPGMLLSGDHKKIAEKTAQQLAIPEVCAEVLPDAKLSIIRDLQEHQEQCLMVGDGLNDAPALAQAHVSISPSTGMDITQNTADIVFQGSSLKAVYLSWKMARYSTHLVKQNFALAVLYNCCAIPIAVAGYVTPMVAAIAMSASSLIVIGNSFRIRLVKEG